MRFRLLFTAALLVPSACNRGSSSNDALEPERVEASSVSVSAPTAAATEAKPTESGQRAARDEPAEQAPTAAPPTARRATAPAVAGAIDVTPSAANGYCKRMEAGKCLQHCYPSPTRPGVCLAKPHGQTAPEPPKR